MSPLAARIRKLRDEGIEVCPADEVLAPGRRISMTCGWGDWQVVRMIESFDRPDGRVYLHELERVNG